MINMDPNLVTAKDQAIQELKETIEVIMVFYLITKCLI